MTTLIEASKQALEALDCIYSPLYVREINKVGKARLALRTAIEQAEKQEPVASEKAIAECLAVLRPAVKNRFPQEQALEELADYLAATPAAQPAQREWVGLTARERDQFFKYVTMTDLVKAIEAKLKEKNT